MLKVSSYLVYSVTGIQRDIKNNVYSVCYTDETKCEKSVNRLTVAETSVDIHTEKK